MDVDFLYINITVDSFLYISQVALVYIRNFID